MLTFSEDSGREVTGATGTAGVSRSEGTNARDMSSPFGLRCTRVSVEVGAPEGAATRPDPPETY